MTPHLTIGHDHSIEAMQAAAVQIDARLPVRATATEVRLIIGKTGRQPWRTDETFLLPRNSDTDSE